VCSNRRPNAWTARLTASTGCVSRRRLPFMTTSAACDEADETYDLLTPGSVSLRASSRAGDRSSYAERLAPTVPRLHQRLTKWPGGVDAGRPGEGRLRRVPAARRASSGWCSRAGRCLRRPQAVPRSAAKLHELGRSTFRIKIPAMAASRREPQGWFRPRKFLAECLPDIPNAAIRSREIPLDRDSKRSV
jgi:hypothetical protein